MKDKCITNDDFFKVLGHISIFFATVDFMITILLLRLIDRNKVKSFKSISDRSTLQQKLRFIEKLTSHDVIDNDVLNDIKSILPQAFEISEERNRYTHDQWMFKPDDISKGIIHRTRILGIENWSINLKQEQFTFSELNLFLNKIGELQKSIATQIDKLPTNK